MVPSDHDRRFQFAVCQHLVDDFAEAGSLPVAEPTDARRESLEGNFFAGHANPVAQVLVVTELPQNDLVRFVYVFRVAGEGDPAEGAFAFAKLRPDVRRHKTGEIKGIFHTFVVGDLANVVAVVKGDGAFFLHLEHGLYVYGHTLLGFFHDSVRRRLAHLACVFQGYPSGNVAVEGIVGGRLIRHDVWDKSAPHHFGQNFCRIAEQSDREGLLLLFCFFRQTNGLIEGIHLHVEVSRVEAPLDARFVHFHRDDDAVVHRDGKGLGAAHPAQTSGDGNRAFQRAVKMPPGAFGERLVRSLDDALTADVNPAASRHLSVHDQPFFVQFVEVLPRGPRRDEVGIGD